MGQYFRAVNLDREEKFDPGLLKYYERMRNPDFTVGLTYLMTPTNWDGCGHSSLYSQISDEVQEDLDVTPFEATEETSRRFREFMDGFFPHAGLWAHDDVTVAGDYTEEEIYDRAYDDFTDITEDVLWELCELDLVEKDPKTHISPDMLVIGDPQ